MIKPLTGFILISVACIAFSCTPIKERLEEKKFEKEFEGFTDAASFQVVCKQKKPSPAGTTEDRKDFINSCRDHLVTTLAKFQIAYVYNSDIAQSISPKTRTSILVKGRPGFVVKKKKNKEESTINDPVKAFEYDLANEAKLLSSVSQIEVAWTKSQMEEIKNLYSFLLPGKIIWEWDDGESLNIVYQVQKKDLMQTIKNTPLPFGLEFTR